ncbi:MAG: transmembrane anti-sigma factor [Rhodocyclaceae bacterium]|nr:MAG: transmembrane anti-sigma factor [Rhodocyclaceae bacterium]TND03162.1 MAG: transmembrane anti-sigma factor [Rhodocyclaceae bacterium]
MNDATNFSDERLNAFVDNQLGAQECDEILAAMATDVELGQRLCALRSTKELVRHAYGNVPDARRTRNLHLPVWGGALAASIVLIIGVLVGWLGHHAASKVETPGSTAAWAGGLFAAEPARILIHLDSSQAEQMDAALDLAEAYVAKAGSAQVEIIANHRGLDLLRARTTPYAARIAELKAQHQRVGFVACGQTMARLQRVGEDVALVPEAAVTRTAIEHVAERVQQGWTYLKI